MKLTDADYYRDALAMIAADKLSHEQIKAANLIAETGEQFNAAIWAAIRLNDIGGTDRSDRQ